MSDCKSAKTFKFSIYLFPARAVSTLRYTEAPRVVPFEEELFVGSAETVSVCFYYSYLHIHNCVACFFELLYFKSIKKTPGRSQTLEWDTIRLWLLMEGKDLERKEKLS